MQQSQQICALMKKEDTQHYRLDVLWTHLANLKHPDSTTVFEKLSTVALLVLTLPHSNAEEERIFSMVTKNKTKFQANLKIDGTLLF